MSESSKGRPPNVFGEMNLNASSSVSHSKRVSCDDRDKTKARMQQLEEWMQFHLLCFRISNNAEIRSEFLNMHPVADDHGAPHNLVRFMRPVAVFVNMKGELSRKMSFEEFDLSVRRVLLKCSQSFDGDVLSVDVVDVVFSDPFSGFDAHVSVQASDAQTARDIAKTFTHDVIWAQMAEQGDFITLSQVQCGVDNANVLAPSVSIANIISLPMHCPNGLKKKKCHSAVKKIEVSKWPVCHELGTSFNTMIINAQDQDKPQVRFKRLEMRSLGARETREYALHNVLRLENIKAADFCAVKVCLQKTPVLFISNRLCVVPTRGWENYSLRATFTPEEKVHVYVAYRDADSLTLAQTHLVHLLKEAVPGVLVHKVFAPDMRFSRDLNCEVMCEKHNSWETGSHLCMICSNFFSAAETSCRAVSNEQVFSNKKYGSMTHLNHLAGVQSGEKEVCLASPLKIHNAVASLTSFIGSGECDTGYVRVFLVSCVVQMALKDFRDKVGTIINALRGCLNTEKRHILLGTPHSLVTKPESTCVEIRVLLPSLESLTEMNKAFPTDESVKGMLDIVFGKVYSKCLRASKGGSRNVHVLFWEFMNGLSVKSNAGALLKTPVQSPIRSRCSPLSWDVFQNASVTPHTGTQIGSPCVRFADSMCFPGFTNQNAEGGQQDEMTGTVRNVGKRIESPVSNNPRAKAARFYPTDYVSPRRSPGSNTFVNSFHAVSMSQELPFGSPVGSPWRLFVNSPVRVGTPLVPSAQISQEEDYSSTYESWLTKIRTMCSQDKVTWFEGVFSRKRAP